MAWRPHPRNAATDPSSPRAWGTCARCHFVQNLDDMTWQMAWRGTQVKNTQVLVCESCLDELQRQLGSIVLPPDPVAVRNARPEPYSIDERWPRLTQDGQPRYLQGNQQPRTMQYSFYDTNGTD